jgi:uncharacterized protein (TIGR03437 family)
MISFQFTHALKSFAPIRIFSLRRARRGFAWFGAWLLISASATLWFQGRHTVGAQGGPINTMIISTVAGGGFGSNILVRQAPMSLLSVVALDPQGRGFYVVDDLSSGSLLRFVNTTESTVTLAGTQVFGQSINLIAGGGIQAGEDVAGRDADLLEVTGLAVDPTGNAVYLCSSLTGSVRVLNVGTQSLAALGRVIAPGKIATVLTPPFTDLRALAFHPTTQELYFIGDRIVYRIDSAGNPVAFAGGGNPITGKGDGGPATQARIVSPLGLAFDSQGNLLIAEAGDARSTSGSLRKVTPPGTISTLAGNLDYPVGVATGPGDNAYVALGNSQQILRVAANGGRTAIAGNNSGIACDPASNPTCGDGGAATSASLNLPDSTEGRTLVLAVDAAGLYLPDYNFKRVRYVNLGVGTVNVLGTSIGGQKIDTIVGNGIPAPYDNGPATAAELLSPTGVAVDAQGNFFVADTGHNRLRFVNRGITPVTILAGTPSAQTVEPGQIVTLNKNAGIDLVDDRISTALFASPQGLELTDKGLFIVDSQAGALVRPPGTVTGRRSGLIRFLNTSSSNVTLYPHAAAPIVVPPGMIKDVAGSRPPANPSGLGDNGPATSAAIFPTDLSVDAEGNLYIADQGNNRIRKVSASTGTITTFYGDGTPEILNSATAVAFDNAGRLHIADTRNDRILRQNTAGGSAFTIIADSSGGISSPRGLTVDGSGRVFVTSALAHRVLQVTAPEDELGAVNLVAGTGSAGFAGDGGPADQARLNLPNPGTATNDVQVTAQIIILSGGVIAFTDTRNHRLRLLVRLPGPPPLLDVVSVSGASFTAPLATDSIVSAFGSSLAVTTKLATSTPLPTTLAGTTVKVKDSAGQERLAPLFFVSPRQVNYLIPPGTLTGTATVTVNNPDGRISTGTIQIHPVAPGIFTANSNGQGVAAAIIQRVKPDFSQTFELVARFDTAQGKMVAVPIDLGPEGEQVFLILFGTGLRHHGGLSTVTVSIGEADAQVLYAGVQPDFFGLDQINLRLPRGLIGRGEVDVVVKVGAQTANVIKIHIR